VLDTLPRTGQLQTIFDSGAVLGTAVPQPPDPAQVAAAISRHEAYRALREFRARLYGCLTARPDASTDLVDAIMCADHAVTSLVQLSLVPEFRRGHGALYDALAADRIDEEAFAALLTASLPPLADGDEGRARAAEHDVTDDGLPAPRWPGSPRRRPRRFGRRARGGGGRGSRSAPPRIRARTPGAPQNAGTFTMTHAAATAPARRSRGGSTSSPGRPGTCAPPGPPSPA